LRNTLFVLRTMLLLVMILAAACDNDPDATATSVPATQTAVEEEASETPAPTTEVTETSEVTETAEVTETSEVTAAIEATETSEVTESSEITEESETEENGAPTPTEEVIDVGNPVEVTFVTREGEENINFENQNGDYSVMVNGVSLENFNEALAAPPDGFKWVQIDATLANEAATETIEILQEALFLVDAEGNRYSVEVADEFVSPPLVGQMIETGEFFRGFARFAIPQDTDSAFLEWCLDATCSEAIQAKADSK
jgi:hypothetical protein